MMTKTVRRWFHRRARRGLSSRAYIFKQINMTRGSLNFTTSGLIWFIGAGVIESVVRNPNVRYGFAEVIYTTHPRNLFKDPESPEADAFLQGIERLLAVDYVLCKKLARYGKLVNLRFDPKRIDRDEIHEVLASISPV